MSAPPAVVSPSRDQRSLEHRSDSDKSKQSFNNALTTRRTEAANSSSSNVKLEEKHLDWERHSPSLQIDADQTAVEEYRGPAPVKLREYLPVLAAAIGLVLALAVTQDARRIFWFWIASLLLTTGVAFVDITSRYHASIAEPPLPDASDGFVPWLLFWSLQNLIAFSHTTDHPEEYKSVLCFLPVLTGVWLMAEILIVIRKSRRGQSISQERRC
ncbi:hypothetical protein BT69DRAFT_1316227 [Atractiella rhizophila]|nr:hypothetical protein BT69DRAFT_1316227 [Atractiella rhizophila]